MLQMQEHGMASGQHATDWDRALATTTSPVREEGKREERKRPYINIPGEGFS